ncbi:MAG TPA: DUF4350 domain-containing protein [Bryobacteraceae bacterium]|jgi:hypothetical protein
MKPSLLVALILAAGFTAGVLHLFGVQFAAGDVYPEYSSLRSDPMGTRLLFDSLARLPGITPTRNYLPLDAVRDTGATVLLFAFDPASLSDDSDAVERIEKFARPGNRVVVAFALKPDSKAAFGPELGRAWHVRLAVDVDRRRVRKLYFADARDWTVLDRVAQKTLAIERDFGKGSIVLFSSGDDFTNQSTAAADRLEMVSAALGSYPRIVFDEQHLGIAEAGSLVGLVRRFRLTGMALGLALCAALFIWRSASAFPPPAAAADPVRFTGRTSHAGLLTLLRRHIPPGDLLSACWQEWLAVNQRVVAPDRLSQLAAIAVSSNRPLDALREMHAVLRNTKGTT